MVKVTQVSHDAQNTGDLSLLPCDPSILQLLQKQLVQREPSLHQLRPIIEQDIVLSLKVILYSNAKMQLRAKEPIPVRGIGHGLSILGLEETQSLIQKTVTLNTKQSDDYFHLYRFRVLEAHSIAMLAQKVVLLDLGIHPDDLKFFSALLALPYLTMMQHNFLDAMRLYQAQYYCVAPLEDAELYLQGHFTAFSLENTIKQLPLTEELKTSLNSFIACLKKNNPTEKGYFFKVQSLLKLELRKRNNTAIFLVFVLGIIFRRSQGFWHDRLTGFLIRWVARLSFRSFEETRSIIQTELLTIARTEEVFSYLGKSIFLNSDCLEFDNAPSLEDIKAWDKAYGSFSHHSIKAADILKYPVHKKLGLPAYAQIPSISDRKSESTAAKPRQELEVKQHVSTEQKQPEAIIAQTQTDKRRPGRNIQVFIDQVTQNPRIFGSPLPTSSALLEALRIGMNAECGVTVFVDRKDQKLWVGSVTGLPSLHPVRTWSASIQSSSLFKQFVTKPSALWVTKEKVSGVKTLLPHEFLPLIEEGREALLCSTSNSNAINGFVMLFSMKNDTFNDTFYKVFQKAVRAPKL
ncbi:MAG TPA: hypothetical protein DHW71_07600 [Gammaproteobacteria bacterium]|nr:hypothetical protein [Gammaproteobacteria bacterium]